MTEPCTGGAAKEAKVAIPTPLSERRINMRLMGYWQTLRGSGADVPVERFDPAAISDLWAHCFVIELAGDSKDPSFRHIGEKIAFESRVDTEARKVSEVPDGTLLGMAARLTSEVKQIHFPVVDSGEFQDSEGRRRLYRSILVPFSDKAGAITLLVGAARCTVPS